MTERQIAQIVHEANRGLCEATGDFSQKSWGEAEDWQRESAIAGVRWRLEHMEAPDSAQHEAWMADKRQQGWKWGPVKNAVEKEHPCLVPYEELPPEQQAKDVLFVAIVKHLAQFS